jgi:AraC-like DNA-binding protein
MPEPSSLPLAHVSADGLDRSEAFDCWRENISSIFSVERLDGGHDFHFDLRAYDLGDLVIGRTELDAQRFVRLRPEIRKTAIDHYLIQAYRAGGYRGRAGERCISLSPGQTSFLDLSRPVVTEASHARTISALVPRDLLNGHLPQAERLHGSVVHGPVAELLGDLLQAVYDRLGACHSADVTALSASVLRLMAVLLHPPEVPRDTDALRPAVDELALARARRHIERHLTSPNLTPEAVARAAGVSRATLYRLFEVQGGVSRHIQTRRLQSAFAALVDPGDRRKIQTIAEDLGFASEAHFSRSFHRLFGATPSETRQQRSFRSGKESGQTRSLPPDFNGLVRDLQRRSAHRPTGNAKARTIGVL